jgi:hypothetical protein
LVNEEIGGLCRGRYAASVFTVSFNASTFMAAWSSVMSTLT